MTNFIKRIDIHKTEDASYIWDIPAVKHFKTLEITQPILFLTGENGSGKSTLLEAIAVNYGFNAEGGSKNFQFTTKDTHSLLHRYITLGKTPTKPMDTFFLRAESFYNVASYVDEIFEPYERGEYGGSLHEQSHGESFLNLVMHRFRGHGLYILDEPESALSIQRQFSFMVLLHDLAKHGSQIIIATHSPFLLSMPNAQIIAFQEATMKEITYEETEAYQLTKMFINNLQQFLKHLLEDK